MNLGLLNGEQESVYCATKANLEIRTSASAYLSIHLVGQYTPTTLGTEMKKERGLIPVSQELPGELISPYPFVLPGARL